MERRIQQKGVYHQEENLKEGMLSCKPFMEQQLPRGP
jgi:hypothetical protein